jgi:hypothetical protein
MQSDKPEGTLMVKVGTHGVCFFAWDGISESELADALDVIREFVASERPNLFTLDGERTGKRIAVRTIFTKTPVNRDGEEQRKA